jgi:hypothetical protein
MDIVGRNQGMGSFKTDCDDEETPDEFHALDELYSWYKEGTQSSAESKAENKAENKAESNKNSLAKEKKELSAAEEICQV